METLREDLLRSILSVFNILYDDRDYIRGFSKSLGDPTFDHAEPYIRAALEDFELSKKTVNPLDSDRRIWGAFDALFPSAPNNWVEPLKDVLRETYWFFEYYTLSSYPVVRGRRIW